MFIGKLNVLLYPVKYSLSLPVCVWVCVCVHVCVKSLPFFNNLLSLCVTQTV